MTALKDVLDLLEEFCQLNEAKTVSKGCLPPASERRWRDLKALYDRLMSRPPSQKSSRPTQFAPGRIRARIKHRNRLRIRMEMPAFFRYKGTLLPSRLVNLSCSGSFLGSNVLLSPGARITVYLPNLSGDYGELFETHGEVVWTTQGIPRSDLPRGMGIRFREMGAVASQQLDSYIVEALQKRLEE